MNDSKTEPSKEEFQIVMAAAVAKCGFVKISDYLGVGEVMIERWAKYSVAAPAPHTREELIAELSNLIENKPQ